jgi:hypothetical protein
MSHHRSPALLAPGASTTTAYAPGRHSRLPAVDERLVAPEAHAQVIDGVVIETMGANEPHATEHTEVTHVLRGCLAPGYRAAVDMLTRTDRRNDAAPDVSVVAIERDPETGGRRVEEIAVEVVDTESVDHVTGKARRFARRGVRRVFYVRVASRAVYEWSHADDAWRRLGAADVIEDRCFSVPIPVAALADQVMADDAVARALLARETPVLVAALEARRNEGRVEGRVEGRNEGRNEGRVEGRNEGRNEGRRAALRTLANAAGIALSAGDEARIDACDDETLLDRWITNGRTATTAAALLR